MRHITPWAILLIAALLLCNAPVAADTVTIGIEDLDYIDNIDLYSVSESSNSWTSGSSPTSGGQHSAQAVIRFNNIELFPNLNYVSVYVARQITWFPESGAGTAIKYKRLSDNTFQSGRVYVSYARNIAGSVTGTYFTFTFDNWDIGALSGTKYAYLYYDNEAPVTFMSGYTSATPSTAGTVSLTGAPGSYSDLAIYGGYPAGYAIQTSAVGYFQFKNTFQIKDNQPSISVDLNRVFSGRVHNSAITVYDSSNNIVYSNLGAETALMQFPISKYLKISIDHVGGDNIRTYIYSGTSSSTSPVSSDFTLSLSSPTAAVGDPITATLTNIPTESSRLILNVNGVIHRDITNPYNFSAIGNSGETIYVFANCYDSSNNLLYSSNVVSYTLTGELEPIEPYPELEDVEITGIAPSYTQGNTLTATLNDNSIAGINEIWWKIIPQTDENGNPSTITGKRYEYKEFSTDNWQLKSGSSYTGSYTYADVKSLSHYIDGYGLFDVEVNCYNSTNGLIGIDRVNSYANPASYIKPVSVYIYGNSGLYSGEITLTTEYIVQSKNTTYYIYNGYDSINVVKAGDYNIYVDLTDNSIYKDKVLQYSYDSDGSILRIYLEEDYTVSEHAKLSIRVVDSTNNPLSFANVHFIGLAESSMSTNANGYAEYIGINNETVKFTASKTGYISGEGSITLSDSINSFTLVLSTLTETITPTETSTSPDEDEGYNPFTNFITAIMEFGFNEESAKIIVALGLVGLLFACGVKFGESTGAGLAGAVIGVIFSALLSLIPMWVIMAIILCAAAILATKFYADR